MLKVLIAGDWNPWSNRVPQIEVETHKVAAPDVVVPTLDTVRHESLLYTWLAEHKPIGKYSVSGFAEWERKTMIFVCYTQFYAVHLVPAKR